MVTTIIFEHRAAPQKYELNELQSEVHRQIIAHGLPSFADVLGR